MTDEAKAVRDEALRRIDERYDEFMTAVNLVPLSKTIFRPMFVKPLGSESFQMWRTMFIAESVQTFLEFVHQSKAPLEPHLGRSVSPETALAIIEMYHERIAIRKWGAVPFVAMKFNLSEGTISHILKCKSKPAAFQPLHPDHEMAIKASLLPLMVKLVSGENHAT